MSLNVSMLDSVPSFFRKQFSTLEGFQDSLDVASNVTDWFSELGTENITFSDCSSTIKKTSALLSGYFLLKEGSEVFAKLAQAFTGRTAENAKDVKKSCYSEIAAKISKVALNILNASSNFLVKTNEVGWIKTPTVLPTATVILSGTDIYTSACELFDELDSVNERARLKLSSETSEREKKSFLTKDALSVMYIIKNVTGIAGSLLSVSVVLAGGLPSCLRWD